MGRCVTFASRMINILGIDGESYVAPCLFNDLISNLFSRSYTVRCWIPDKESDMQIKHSARPRFRWPIDNAATSNWSVKSFVCRFFFFFISLRPFPRDISVRDFTGWPHLRATFLFVRLGSSRRECRSIAPDGAAMRSWPPTWRMRIPRYNGND